MPVFDRNWIIGLLASLQGDRLHFSESGFSSRCLLWSPPHTIGSKKLWSRSFIFQFFTAIICFQEMVFESIGLLASLQGDRLHFSESGFSSRRLLWSPPHTIGSKTLWSWSFIFQFFTAIIWLQEMFFESIGLLASLHGDRLHFSSKRIFVPSSTFTPPHSQWGQMPCEFSFQILWWDIF